MSPPQETELVLRVNRYTHQTLRSVYRVGYMAMGAIGCDSRANPAVWSKLPLATTVLGLQVFV